MAIDRLLEEFGDSQAATVQDMIVNAVVNKGIILARLERHEEAVDAFDRAVEDSGSTGPPELRAALATAIVNKAVSLHSLGQTTAAIGAFDELTLRFGGDESPLVAEVVATGLLNRGTMFGHAGQAVGFQWTSGGDLRRHGESPHASGTGDRRRTTRGVGALAPAVQDRAGQALALRARIVLASAEGESDVSVAARLGTTRVTVGKMAPAVHREGMGRAFGRAGAGCPPHGQRR